MRWVIASAAALILAGVGVGLLFGALGASVAATDDAKHAVVQGIPPVGADQRVSAGSFVPYDSFALACDNLPVTAAFVIGRPLV